jgi:hypothetical protein
VTILLSIKHTRHWYNIRHPKLKSDISGKVIFQSEVISAYAHMKTCSKCHVAKASECFPTRCDHHHCKACVNARVRGARRRQTIDMRLNELYNSCKQRHQKLYQGELITLERFKAICQAQDGVCAETGVPFDVQSKFLMPSPDRINNDVGYVDGNIRFVTWRINHMRNNLPIERFQSTCMEVVYPNASILAETPVFTPDNMLRFKIMYFNCKHRHKESEREGAMITLERFEAIYQAQGGVCVATGVPFDWASKDLRPSPDRIDNDVGYVDGNIRFVTWRVNNMRSSLSVEGFQAACMQVVNRNKRKFDAASALLMLRG